MLWKEINDSVVATQPARSWNTTEPQLMIWEYIYSYPIGQGTASKLKNAGGERNATQADDAAATGRCDNWQLTDRAEHTTRKIQRGRVQPTYNPYFLAYFFNRNNIFLS
jgi:hypothetical protein